MAEKKCSTKKFFGKVKPRHSEGEKSPSGATAGKDSRSCGPRMARGAGAGPHEQGRGARCPPGDRTERRGWEIRCGQCFLDRMEWTSLGQCQRRQKLWLKALPYHNSAFIILRKLLKSPGVQSLGQHKVSDDVLCACRPQVHGWALKVQDSNL